MKFRAKLSILLLSLAFLPCISAPADAAQISTSSSGNGVFVLSGAGLSDVWGIQADITYDTATLANPRISQGGLVSGDMFFIPNPNLARGVLRIVVASRSKVIASSGVVATITFDRLGEKPGSILFLNPTLYDKVGNTLGAPQVVMNNPMDLSVKTGEPTDTPTPPPPSDTSGTGDTSDKTNTGGTGTTTGGTTTGTGQGSAAPGTITIPGEAGELPKQQAPEIPPEQPAAEAKGAGTAEPAAEAASKSETQAAEPPAPPKQVIHPSVLERFREFKGEKTPQSLTALFDAAVIPGVRQEPAVVLTDGKTRVKVSIQIPSAGKTAPNFALKGAKLISLKKEEGTWVVEALPAAKVHEATITVMHNGSSTEIPLSVAPPLEAASSPAGGPGEAGFSLFLKERGTDKAPRFDLNGDGVRNYIDDYIFTANFIVKRDSTTKVPPQKQMIW